MAQSKRAHALVGSAPERVSELALLAEDTDWLVAMRAMDLLEKLAHEHVDWVQPHHKLFIGPLADSDKWELRLQVVRALPLLKWTAREQERVIEILVRDIKHPHTFVRAWALDSLATFAEDESTLIPIVKRALKDFEGSGSKALRTRARHIRARLEAAPALHSRSSRLKIKSSVVCHQTGPMRGFRAVVRDHPLVWFFLLAYAASWALWLPAGAYVGDFFMKPK